MDPRAVVDLDPVRGSEANKRRPAVIVSNDGANSTAERLGRGVLTVAPVTSRSERVYPFQVLCPHRLPGCARTQRLRPSRSGRWPLSGSEDSSVSCPRTWLRPWTRRYDFILRSDPALDVTQRLWPR